MNKYQIKTNDIINHFIYYNQEYLDSYGEVLQVGMSKPPEITLKWLGEILNIKEGDRVLDCGSGFGYPAAFLADKFKCNVLGLNITECQLLYSEKFRSKRCNFIKFDFNDINNLSYKPNKIIFLETFGYTENPKELLKKCLDILPIGGIILIKSIYLNSKNRGTLKEIEDFYHYHFFKIADILKWVYEVGLNPLLNIRTSFGMCKNVNHFLSLIKKRFEVGVSWFPYTLILQKLK